MYYDKVTVVLYTYIHISIYNLYNHSGITLTIIVKGGTLGNTYAYIHSGWHLTNAFHSKLFYAWNTGIQRKV
jgi:hypothetical protein